MSKIDVRQQFFDDLSLFTTYTRDYGNLDVTSIDDIIDCFDKNIEPIIVKVSKYDELISLLKEEAKLTKDPEWWRDGFYIVERIEEIDKRIKEIVNLEMKNE